MDGAMEKWLSCQGLLNLLSYLSTVVLQNSVFLQNIILFGVILFLVAQNSLSTNERRLIFFDFSKSFLLIGDKTSGPIENHRGLRQGSALSPTMFNFFITGLIELLDAQAYKEAGKKLTAFSSRP
jgi:hypothetical protein